MTERCPGCERDAILTDRPLWGRICDECWSDLEADLTLDRNRDWWDDIVSANLDARREMP